MFEEILSSPVAWFITIIVTIHLSILVFMARQKLKREAQHAKHLKSELEQSEQQIQRLFDTMDDNRRVLTESIRELASIEDELEDAIENQQEQTSDDDAEDSNKDANNA